MVESTLQPVPTGDLPVTGSMDKDAPSPAVELRNLGKSYRVWKTPTARLKALCLQGICKILPEPAIQSSLHRQYQQFNALEGVELTIPRGECIGIIGRNGSGKSTLLQIIAGILEPSMGSVSTSGKVAALLELGSGFNEEFTGRENVYLNASLYGYSRKETDAIFPQIEAFAEIGGFIDQKVRTYSSGMIVRLAFSVLAHVKPDILIIDEALAVGDAFFVQKCVRWLQEYIKSHTVIVVSHDMSLVTRFCDRVLWLHQGRPQYLGDPKRATELYLESQYSSSIDHSEAVSALSGVHVEASDQSGIRPEDARQKALNTSGDTKIPFFSFDAESPSFGEGRVLIESVSLREAGKEKALQVIRGGELVQLKVSIRAKQPIESPIVGFGIKNRFGQELFHDNTYLSSHLSGQKPLQLASEETAVAEFTFVMPYLPSGDHFLFAAVAVGTHDAHTQEHWIHEAIKLTPASDRVVLGLMGLPMQEVRFQKSPDSTQDLFQ
ncbi:MAG: ABC transporter ATP-binding protein [Opitutales bacterium]|nr:ABC transporter ATP-binding protein [Opitutales bacterium]